ncbi:MAG TPA: hypothetical protein PKV66_02010 [Candidatus Pelethenecus sp.]|nr:hypothetical protein [Candidatus Pelethenecus sp.]
MININGEEKRIVLFDTNCLSEIINNKGTFIKNLLERFNPKEYVYAITYYNIIELYHRDENSKKKIKEFLSHLPILLFVDIGNVIVEEYKNCNVIAEKLIMTSLCDLDNFNVSIYDYFSFLDRNTDSGFFDRMDKLALKWMEEREKANKNWKEKFTENLLQEMNECSQQFFNDLSITTIGKYKSLEVQAYIKNEFITQTNQEIKRNSVIDSYNASYIPYVDAFITERFVGSIIQQAKKKLKYLTLEICKISELYD